MQHTLLAVVSTMVLSTGHPPINGGVGRRHDSIWFISSQAINSKGPVGWAIGSPLEVDLMFGDNLYFVFTV